MLAGSDSLGVPRLSAVGGFAQRRATARSGGDIDLIVVNHDTVFRLGLFDRNPAIQHIIKHPLGLTLQRRPVAPAAGSPELEPVAGMQFKSTLGWQWLGCLPGAHDLGPTQRTGVATRQAPGSKLVPIAAHRWGAFAA